MLPRIAKHLYISLRSPPSIGTTCSTIRVTCGPASHLRPCAQYSNTSKGRTYWLPEELTLLKSLLEQGKSIAEIQTAHFPHRTLSACKTKAHSSGCRQRSFWIEDERLMFRKPRQEGLPYSKIQARYFPARSKGSIMRHGSPSSVPVVESSTKWTSAQDALLLDLRKQGKKPGETMHMFPNRSEFTLVRRIGVLLERKPDIKRATFSPLTEAEDHRLRSLHENGASVGEIAHALRRPWPTIKVALTARGLEGDRERKKVLAHKRWSSEEIQTVQTAMINDQRSKLLSLLPHRTPSAIQNTLARLRHATKHVSKAVGVKWTAVEFKELEKLLDESTSNRDTTSQQSVIDFAKRFGRTTSAIRSMLSRMRATRNRSLTQETKE